MKIIYTKAFIIYLAIFSAFLISTFSYNHVFSDEGTHLLLSVFYKDLISNLPSLGFSYNRIYDFSINYLVHYPKLQIAYPPVYHISNALAFFILEPSIFAARLVNLLYAVLTFCVFFILVKKYSNEKTAFISTIFFSSSAYSLLYASRAFQDFSAYFFILLSLFIFSEAIEKQKTKYSVLLSITIALSILSKQISGILVLFFIAYVVLRKDIIPKQKARHIAAFLIPAIVILIPYILLLKSVGGFEINQIVAVNYAGQQGEPTNILDPMFWLYLIIQPAFSAPFTILFFLSLVYYIRKKEKYWKEFLLFSLIFYFSLSIIPNKELRFSQLFLLPAYIAFSSYLTKFKNKAIVPGIILVYIIISLAVFYPSIQSYPQQKVSDYLIEKIPENASIALLSDDEPLFSSSIISSLAANGTNSAIIRPCAFGNKTKEGILKILDESNTYFLVYSAWTQDKTIEKIKETLNLETSISYNNLTTEIYTYKNFQNKKPQKLCNYICLTGEKICGK